MSEFDSNEDRPKPQGCEDEIKHLLRADPFRRFTIVLTSGDRYTVYDPYSLAIGESSMSSLYPPKGGTMMFGKSQIVSIEITEPADT